MELTAPYEQARERESVRRGFWLTSLIVGTSILVWLTLLGSVAVGVGLAFAANDISDAFNNNTPASSQTPAFSQTPASSQNYLPPANWGE
jgi:hypothetical protein